MSTELKIYNSDNNHESSFIRDGINGNYDVVFQMVRLVRNTVKNNKAFQDLINNEILLKNKFDRYANPETVAQKVFDFVTKNVTYVSDIAGKVESIKSADLTLSDGYGDCDDISILYASILGVLGYEPDFILASYSAKENQFSHIYVELIAQDKRFVFDNAINPPTFNKEVKPYKTQKIDIFDTNETDGLTGFFKTFAMSIQQIYKHGLETIPTIASFTPIGAIAYTTLATGASLASASLDRNLSLSELGSRINRQLDTIICALHQKQIAFDYAVVSAKQIASQINGFANSNQLNEYRIITNGIKNKLQFINNFAESNNYHVTLNHKGIALGGAAIVGYFAYQGYKYLNQ